MARALRDVFATSSQRLRNVFATSSLPVARCPLPIARSLLIVGLLFGGLLLMPGVATAATCFFHSDAVGYVCDANPPPPVFNRPEPVADSFLPEMDYAKLHDLIDVYPEPTTSVPPVRNVGDGFLFATVQAAVQNEAGELWYMINYGEYVRAEDLELVEISEFAGVEVRTQPERLFGWMVADYWYSDAPNTEPEPGTPKLPRYTFFEVYDAVEADDGWIWYDIGNGRWMRQTYVSVVDVDPRPEDVGKDEFWVEVDLYEQTFAAYEGDRMVYAGLVSSGLNRWPTNEGMFQVWSRYTEAKMSGAEGKEDYYFIEDVPHTMYFDYDIALHGAYWHDRFGYKHSHGCVNMPPFAAEWVFQWSANAPNDLWVKVHTSDPATYFESHGSIASSAGT
jgi:lipoprotein-anchoring transpeptidase ErfK/SrfK